MVNDIIRFTVRGIFYLAIVLLVLRGLKPITEIKLAVTVVIACCALAFGLAYGGGAHDALLVNRGLTEGVEYSVAIYLVARFFYRKELAPTKGKTG